MTAKPKLSDRMDAVERALGLQPKAGVKDWIKDHVAESIGVATLLVAVMGLVIAYLTWWQPQWKADAEERLTNKIHGQVDSSFKDHKFDEMARDLAEIKGQVAAMQPFLQMLTQSQLRTSAALSLPAFEKRLPELKVTLSAATVAHAEAPTDVIINIHSKLVKSGREYPGFWGTAAALITYQSPKTQNEFPACVQTDPSQHLTWKQLDHLEKKGVPPPDQVTVHDCLLDLDSSLTQSHFSIPTQTDAISIVCDRCQVTYSGGPIPLFEAKGYVNIIFKNCTFAFAASDNSPGRGKDFIGTVLETTDLQDVHYEFPIGI